MFLCIRLYFGPIILVLTSGSVMLESPADSTLETLGLMGFPQGRQNSEVRQDLYLEIRLQTALEITDVSTSPLTEEKTEARSS